MALTRRPCDYLVIKKPRMFVLGFYILEKWIESFFVSDSRSWTMAGVDVVVRKSEELSLNAMEELFHATSREVGPSDGFAEKSISRQD